MNVDIPVNVSLPLLGIGVVTLLLSLIFCCYMWRLKRQARHDRGYRRIKFSPKKKKLPNDTCPVCLDEFSKKENIAVCPCYHGFHVKCLMEWLRHRNNCPMCKAPVQTTAGERTGLINPEASRNIPVANV